MDELEARVDALLEQLAEAKEVLAPIQDEMVKVESEEYQIQQAYREQMRILGEKKAAIKAKKDAAISKQAQIQNEVQIAKNKLEQEKAEAARKEAELARLEREAAMYQRLGKRFEDATMGAPWREFAKEHQLEAGRKLATDRYVIEADAMGLGKTLSSIIMCDMTEKATRDVNPEFPLLGEEVEVHVPPKTVWTQKAIDALKADEWPFGMGPLGSKVHVIPSITPFDDNQYTIQGNNVSLCAPIPYLPYDLQNRLNNEGYTEKVPATTKTEIVNSITRPVGRRVLYFCPAPLLRNVLEEWRRWSPARNVTYIGAMSKAERNFALSFLPKLDDYVIIVNYEAWRRDKALLTALEECQFDTFIIDEAHSIKDRSSIGYKGVKQVIDSCKPEYIVPMTGTPILNRPQEFFALLTLLNLKEFPNTPQGERDFLWKYCEQYYIGDSTAVKYRFKEGGIDRLMKSISKNIIRRTKDQAGIILPEKAIIHHDLDKDDENYPKQAEAREHMKKFATIVLNKEEGKAISATVIIALITRLRQIETWPAGIKSKTTYFDKDGNEHEELVQLLVEESQKIDYTIRFDETSQEWEGLIPDNIDNERMVVFSQFKAPLHELKRRIELMGRTCVIIDGDTPAQVRDDARLDFDRSHTPDRSKSRWDVALCNYKAAGVGLNLTAATNMVILDQEWNPGKRDQAYDRLHRIGQTENVTINVLNVKNTIDDWLNEIMEAKEKDVKGLDSAMVGANDLLNAIESGLI